MLAGCGTDLKRLAQCFATRKLATVVAGTKQRAASLAALSALWTASPRYHQDRTSLTVAEWREGHQLKPALGSYCVADQPK